MTNEEMQKLTSSMQEKLGKENASLIADDIGTLITDNSNMNKEITSRDSQIEKLKKDKENLITTNGNLLQQVAMSDDIFSHNPKKEKEKKDDFNFKDAFDDKGNFKI